MYVILQDMEVVVEYKPMSDYFKEDFVPDVYECLCGKETISSKYSGHYCSCSCGACAVDQTEHYTRWIGGKLKYVNPTNENSISKSSG